ncbi:MAG: hypothetical protein BWX86_02338 [Verrucomicrobia bacterium ADurb.Bin122]|nr:MAG: hypothetical protein BWX86_02338 [Verrucomicrobia bacterium ADurb.Bin122]
MGALRLDDLFADFQLKLLVDHGGDDLPSLGFALRLTDAAYVGEQVAHDFPLHGLFDVLSGGRDGGGGADFTEGGEPDVVRAGGDDRAGGDGLVVHIGQRESGKFPDRLHDVFGDVEGAAWRFHIKDDHIGFLLDGFLQPAADDVEGWGGDLLADGDDDDIGAFGRR